MPRGATQSDHTGEALCSRAGEGLQFFGVFFYLFIFVLVNFSKLFFSMNCFGFSTHAGGVLLFKDRVGLTVLLKSFDEEWVEGGVILVVFLCVFVFLFFSLALL